jgi:hypothetical protein
MDLLGLIVLIYIGGYFFDDAFDFIFGPRGLGPLISKVIKRNN